MMSLMLRLGFPPEACEALTEADGRLAKTALLSPLWKQAQNDLLYGTEKDFVEMLKTLAQTCDVPQQTLDMVFLLRAVPYLGERYREKGYSEELLYETMTDLRYKLLECHALCGLWGTTVTAWYAGFFRCNRFSFGRLQMEWSTFRMPETYFYRTLVRGGETVVACHIPSSGPLLTEDVMASLRRAYAFFGNTHRDGKLIVTTSSWLVYPPYQGTVFPVGSNVYRFAALFDVISEKDTDFGDFWRVFNVPYSKETLANVPEDTSMRRRMKQYLQNGGIMGSGYGVIVFDGEKIV